MTKKFAGFFISLVILFSFADILFADDGIDGGKTMIVRLDHTNVDGYALWIPGGFYPAQKWPIIYSLHSSAEVGSGIENALEHGPASVIEKNTSEELSFLKKEFLVISPHMKAGEYKNTQWYLYTDILNQVLDSVIQKYNGDSNRVYLIGYSMGATGTWGYLSRHPEKFAAAIPICGYTQRARGLSNIIPGYDSFRDVPIWIFHNVWDNVVPFRHSQYAAEDIEKISGEKFQYMQHDIVSTKDKTDMISIKEKDEDIIGKKRLFSRYNIYIHDHGNTFDCGIIYRWMLSHSK